MKIKYGKQTLETEFKHHFDILDKKFNSTCLSNTEIMEKLNHKSHYSESLDEIIDNAEKILIILPDITRMSGADKFLKDLVGKINDREKSFSFIFATGTHRKLTEDEKKSILTNEIYEKYSGFIIDHDPDNVNDMIYYGKTKRNTPVLLNRSYYDHDTIMPVSSVSYHYFAGFGGARKMLMPGIASRKSALNNHKLALDEKKKTRNSYAVTGNLKQNPVHDDIVEAIMIARARKNFYAVNTILDEYGEVADVEGGDLFISHIKACESLKNFTRINIEEKYDSVICSCGGYPKDINMIQAQKSLDRVRNIAKPNAKLLFFAECSDGYGNKTFEDFFHHGSSAEMADALFSEYKINRQTAFNLRKITENFECYIYTEMASESVSGMGFKEIKHPDDLNILIGSGEKTAFIPNASAVLPVSSTET